MKRPLVTGTKFQENLRSVHVAFRNAQRSPRATRRDVLEAELTYRRAQFRRAFTEAAAVHVLLEQCEGDLAELEASEAVLAAA